MVKIAYSLRQLTLPGTNSIIIPLCEFIFKFLEQTVSVYISNIIKFKIPEQICQSIYCNSCFTSKYTVQKLLINKLNYLTIQLNN